MSHTEAVVHVAAVRRWRFAASMLRPASGIPPTQSKAAIAPLYKDQAAPMRVVLGFLGILAVLGWEPVACDR